MPTAEGWLYVAAIKDLFAGEIVGRTFGERMTTDLITRALEQAVAMRRPTPGWVHHSDRGSQYCSYEYRRLLQSCGMRVSMSRRGNCYDNAPVESFWGTLKNELVHHRRYETHLEAVREISEYIDLVLQPGAAASPPRLCVTGGVHATVHAAATGGVSITHGVHF